MSNDRTSAFSRRGFLKGTAAASLGTAATAAGVTPAAADTPAPTPPHGAELRGLDLATQSPTTEGRFGFMFKNQPPHAAPETLLTQLGQVMEERPIIGQPLTNALTGEPIMVKASDGTPTDVQMTTNKDHNDSLGENPNDKLASGFTFVGQFVDHDITFDTTPLSEQESDPYATTNYRVPRYDLDSLYGRGPTQDPQFYNPADRDKFLVKEVTHTVVEGLKVTDPETPTKPYNVMPMKVWDVDRDGGGKAIIADPRNDQTLIILQLHVAFQLFHNKLVDLMRKSLVPRASVFESARRMARWHYQWMVIHEFLPAIVGQPMLDSVYKEVLTGVPIINIKYYKPTNPLGKPFIPVEFSVAAYRFGHSITRPRYTVQDVTTTDVDPKTGKNVVVAVSSVPLFEAKAGYNNLNGSRPVPPRLKIQWSKFFNDPLATPRADKTVPRTARPVRQFDATLATPLATLPSTALPDSNPMSRLSARNLLRGKKMGLPSGQQVARLMGLTPLTNDQLWKDHRIEVKIPIPTTDSGVKPYANVVEILREFDVENGDLKKLFADPGWNGEAPLWFYILKEAEIVGRGRTLGPVGGRIVTEVLVGLLQKDLNSYLYLNPAWKPTTPIARVRGQFGMADLLKFTGIWS